MVVPPLKNTQIRCCFFFWQFHVVNHRLYKKTIKTARITFLYPLVWKTAYVGTSSGPTYTPLWPTTKPNQTWCVYHVQWFGVCLWGGSEVGTHAYGYANDTYGWEGGAASQGWHASSPLPLQQLAGHLLRQSLAVLLRPGHLVMQLCQPCLPTDCRCLGNSIKYYKTTTWIIKKLYFIYILYQYIILIIHHWITILINSEHSIMLSITCIINS